MKPLLDKLIHTFGVTGREDAVRELIENRIEELGLKTSTDNMGNVVVTLSEGKDTEKYMVSANMDTAGLIVNFIEDNGYLRVHPIGAFNALEVANGLVVFQNGVVGRCCLAKKDGTMNDMYVDIGASSKEEALALVKEGAVAVFKGESITQGKFIMAPNLTNRAACYVLLQVIENLVNEDKLKEIKKNVTIAFTTQSYLRLKGAKALTHTVEPDKVLVIDTEEAGDTLGGKGALKLGKGLGLRVMDGNLIIHHEMKEELQSLTDGKLINIVSTKSSDGGILQKEGKGAKVGVVAIPCRYPNTSQEVMSEEDIEMAKGLVESFILK